MKRQILLGVAALFLLGQTLYAQQPSYRPGVVLVRFANVGTQPPNTAAKNTILNSVLQSGGNMVKQEYALVPGLTKVAIPAGMSVENAVVSLKQSASVLYAGPDYICRMFAVPNDTRFGELWGMRNIGQTGGTPGADISATSAWDISTGSNNIIVAVTDTGVDYSHPDLNANMWRNPGEIPGNGIDDDGNGYIDDVYGYDAGDNDGDPMDDANSVYLGHGTHVAGTIGAVGNNNTGVAGVCWNVKIMAVKIMDANGDQSLSSMIPGIEYAINKGAKVINASWGWDPGVPLVFLQPLYDAIAAARNSGVIFVAAAGNNYGNNNDNLPVYPASFDLDNIISVMATTDTDQMSYYSNYGLMSVDLGAPGGDIRFGDAGGILSTLPGNQYGFYQGTSMASPHIAGNCALLLSIDPTLSYSYVKQILIATADSTLPGLCVSGGRMNLAAAAQEAATDTTPPTPDPAVWQFPPQATGWHTISMEAGLGTDRSGVEYYFECANDVSINSGWQINPLYSFTTLNPSTTYGFHFKARDTSESHNETQWSTTLFTTTSPDQNDNLPPAPTPPQWAIKPRVQRVGFSNYKIRMLARGVDESGVQFRFTWSQITPPGSSGATLWQSSDYTFEGAVLGRTYQFQFEARDAFGNTTGLSDSATITVAAGTRVLSVPVPYPTIQSAIIAANNGDTVVVSPGTYRGDGNWDVDFRGKAITVRSINPENSDTVANTVIDCFELQEKGGVMWHMSHSGFWFIWGETSSSILSGLTIINGFEYGGDGRDGRGAPDISPGQNGEDGGDGGDAIGGGIIVWNGSPTIRNCVLRDCVALGGLGGRGGDGADGVDFDPGDPGDPNDPNVPVVLPTDAIPGGNGGEGGNAGSAYGGGIYVGPINNPFIQNCTITNCYAQPGEGGDGGNGGVGGNGSDDPPSPGACGGFGGNGGNTGVSFGGGLFVEGSATATLVGCVFEDCSAFADVNVGNGGIGGEPGENAPDPPICLEPNPPFVWDPNNSGLPGVDLGTADGGGAYYNAIQPVGTISISASSFERNYADTNAGGLGFARNGQNTINISDCNFFDNIADGNAGGIYYKGGTTGAALTLTRCTFTGNDGGRVGGGLFVGDIFLSLNSVVNISDSSFTNNVANDGGGAYLNIANLTVDGSTFTNNEAYEGGGLNGFNCFVNITDSYFIDNSAITPSGLGGGIALWNTTGKVVNCELRGNSSDYYGGGAFITGWTTTPLNFINCLITDNSTTYAGGGINCTISGWAKLRNCTLVNNSATDRTYGEGGGVSSSEFFSWIQILDSILWDNSAAYGPQIAVGSVFGSASDPGGPFADVDVDHSDVEGGEWAAFIEDPDYTAVWWLPGSIYQDPLFIEIDVNEPAYYLSHIAAGQRANSPCIDAGSIPASDLESPLLVGKPLTTRTDHVRDAGIVDMGYHYIAGSTGTIKRYKLTIEVRDAGFGKNGRLLAEANGDNPFSIMDTNTIELNQGTVADLTAIADPTFRVRWWQGSDDDTSTEPTNTVTMNSDRKVVVSFEPDGLYLLSVTIVGGQGTVVPLGVSLRVPGEVVTLTAVPSNPTDAIIWTGTDNDASSAGQNTVTMTGHRDVTVRFYTPRILYVGADNNYPTIQLAINDANDHDIVLVTPGIYNIYESSEDNPYLLIDSKNIRLTSTSPEDPTATTIIGGFIIRNVDRSMIIEGFTIRDAFYFKDYEQDVIRAEPNPNIEWGWATPQGTGIDGYGGGTCRGAGMELYDDASPTIRNCQFVNCWARGWHGADGSGGIDAPPEGNGYCGNGGPGGKAFGGAVYCGVGGNPLFENVSFEGNKAIPGDAGNGGSAAPAPGGHGGAWGDNEAPWWEYTYEEYWKYSGYGGAVYCDTNSRAEFYNCTFSDNNAVGSSCGISGTNIPSGWPSQHYKIESFGGAVYAATDSFPAFYNCVFADNRADMNGKAISLADNIATVNAYPNVSFGGAVAYEDGASPRFESCTFNNNQATVGGGVYNAWAFGLIDDANFVNNYSYHGGGILMVGADIPIHRSNFIGNQATATAAQGGAITSLGSNTKITDCTIRDNNSLGYGAGIYISSKYIDGIDLDGNDTVLVKNCLITNNTAVSGGAGITATWHSDPNIVGCTITGNRVTGGGGGGIYSTYNNYTHIINSIIWGNSATMGREIAVGVPANPSTVDISYSDVNQTSGSIVVGNGCTLHLNAGIINANPLFADGTNTYYLSQTAAGQASNSPCVDTGSDLVSRFGMGRYTTRTDRLPDGDIVDMGYHYPLEEGCLVYDFVEDGIIAFEDLAYIARLWLTIDYYDLWDFSYCWLYGERRPISTDTIAPTPDPMQWSIEPASASISSVTMTAATATDDSGGIIEYQFEETTNNTGGTDSAWQTSTVYTDSGLLQNTQYCYRVRAQDEAGNITGWSIEVCVSNLGDTNAPTPAPTMIMGPNNVSTDDNTGSGQFQWDFTFDWWNKIVVDVSGITDDSGGQVEVKFICLDDSSLNSDSKIPASSRPIFIDTAVSLGSKADGYRLNFDGANIVYDVFTGQWGGTGTNRRWKVCVYDLSGNETCSEVHIIGPAGLP